MTVPSSGLPLPQVGDAVYYYAYGTPGGEYPAAVPRAAVITEVADATNPHSAVGLAVLNPGGLFFNPHVAYGPDVPGHWGRRPPLAVAGQRQRITESAAPATEAGARHSAQDCTDLQAAHDAMVRLGAVCVPPETPTPPATTESATPQERQFLYEALTSVREGLTPASFDAAQGVLTFTIIRPGFNTSKTRYYTTEAVAAIVAAMRGCKQYLNHPTPTDLRERPERDLGAWVSSISETWVDPNDGAGKGKTTITDPAFLAKAQRLSATGLLGQLGASINAVGLGQKAVMEGVETFLVEGIDPDDPFRSVDWVTEPGAGGRAELLEAHAPGDRAGAALPLQEMTMDPEEQTKKEQAPDAAAEDPGDAALDARLTKVETAIAQLTDLVTQIVNATGLDGMLAQVPAPEAAKEAARSRLITQKGPHTLVAVHEAVQAEITRAAAILGQGTGVQGLGSRSGDSGVENPDEQATTDLREALARQGLSGAALDRAVRGR